jgi:hypothetical protein
MNRVALIEKLSTVQELSKAEAKRIQATVTNSASSLR